MKTLLNAAYLCANEKSKAFLLGLSLTVGMVAFSQPQFPCKKALFMTRQVSPSPTTQISYVDFVPGDVNIVNTGTVAGSNLNASVYYNGYIYAQNWTASATATAFVLNRVDSNYATTSYTVSGMPANNSTYNNAGISKAGIMYLITPGTLDLYAIDLTLSTPAVVAGYPKTCTMTPSQDAAGNQNYGDIAIDPVTDKAYLWYHPGSTSLPAAKGLYEITNYNTTASASVFVKVGGSTPNTFGSLFFNDQGQLYGYGSPDLTNPQVKLYAIDKATGVIAQYGADDIQVTQSDGCNCAFRVSMDRTVSVPLINISKCAVDSFDYTFKIKNYSASSVSNITFNDTLDSRLSYQINTATLQASLRTIYGSTVVVALSDYSGGKNNLLIITNLVIPVGVNSFITKVKVDANNFTGAATIPQQAYLSGLPLVSGGPTESSDNPVTFTFNDKTPITINLTGNACQPPLADNFVNLPMPQSNAATSIPPPTGSDPDGKVVSLTIKTIPNAATEGVLTYCPLAPAACTAGQLVNVSANTVLTPPQESTLTFDPVSTFIGTAKFTFFSTDNSGLISSDATYSLPVTSLPPVSNNIMETVRVNTTAAAAIKPLSSADPDGTIASYKIATIMPASEGVLSYCPLAPSACTLAQMATITANTVLTPAQILTLMFDPTAGFLGYSTFTYNATDNSNNVSNTANYTIPVLAGATNQTPPLADNIFAQPLNNSLAATAIPALSGSDLDGTVSSYTIKTIPPSSQGILQLCNPTCANVTAGQVIAPADIAKLKFDPDPSFIGNATFTYTALDNTNKVSNTATYTIPVVNTPPTATNVNITVPYNSSNNVIPTIAGSDKDGTVSSFTITTLPSSGTLQLCNPTCANVTLNQVISAADAAKLKFTPANNFFGNVVFNYTSTDNNGNTSTPAIYTITVTNAPPISKDISSTVLPNTNGATAIPALNSTDADGTVSSYTIQTLPTPNSGVLYLNGVAITAGQVLTPTDINNLTFDPAANYTGVANFTYTATDNSGNISNVANYNLPISGVGNLPPIANNIIIASMPNTNAATAIATLSGTDPDGTVASYTIQSLPLAASGILYVNGVAVTAGQVLTTAQISQLSFDPSPGYTGYAVFSYTNNDNTGSQSNLATYTIPVTGTPPVAVPIISPSMPNTNAATGIPVLSGSDADGSVVSYTIETLPLATQSVLSLNGTAITAGQILTPAQLSQLQFDPAATYQGDVIFNYHVTDNSGLKSNSTTYTIPVTNNPPMAQNVTASKRSNTSGTTAIGTLSATDADGSIASYIINSIPPASQGVLYLCNPSCVAVTVGQVIAPADAAKLQFNPNTTFSGQALFNYTAIDNNGNSSNTATFSIPTGSALLLPIEGLQLTASLRNSLAIVSWTTLTETNSSHFIVERSMDNNIFTSIGNVAASGFSTTRQSYTFNDNLPAASTETFYYRIKQVDRDGNFTYSNVAVGENER